MQQEKWMAMSSHKFSFRRVRAALAPRHRGLRKRIGQGTVLLILALAAGVIVIEGETGLAQGTQGADVRVVAVNIPGASAIAQIGTFLNVPPPQACAS
jgi:hypothetical protein